MKYKVYIEWIHTPEWTPHNWDSEEFIVDSLEKALEDVDYTVAYVSCHNGKFTKIEIKEV